MKAVLKAINTFEQFLKDNPGVKSVWRAAVIVTLAALASSLGYGDVVRDVAEALAQPVS